MKQREPITINLPIGYTDKEGNHHTSVTIGRAATGGDLLMIDLALQGQSEMAYTLQLLCIAITRFGSLPMPVSSGMLLSLDSINLEDLIAAYNTFYESCGNPIIEQSSVKLVFGLEIGGVIFDMVELSDRATGEDAVEAERCGFYGTAGFCFVAGRQVSRLWQSEGDRVIEGQLSFIHLTELDGIDMLAIMTASKLWRKSIRRLARLLGVDEEAALDIAAKGGPKLDSAINRIIGQSDN